MRPCPRVVALLAGVVAGCAAPEFARFGPMQPGGERDRVERRGFSIAVPQGFELRHGDDATALDAFENPPDNGRYRVYRTLKVQPVAAVVAGDVGAMSAAALAALQRFRASDGLEVLETGRAELAGREGWFLRGTIAGPAAGWRLDVLDYYVPAATTGFVVAFTGPEGQLAACREACAATAASLRAAAVPVATPVPEPVPGSTPDPVAASLTWFDGNRIALQLPGGWLRLPQAEGLIASLRLEGGRSSCTLTHETLAGDLTLERFARDRIAEHAAKWADLRLLLIDRQSRSGRTALRVCAACRDTNGGDTIVIDDTFVVGGGSCDRLTLRCPLVEYQGNRAAIEQLVASLRWQK
ncbi:MAG: hypothetical protein KDC98_08390 [Planctomycetes bacterium]|nr:hypothetical protein [Planctomycetota bacterium]